MLDLGRYHEIDWDMEETLTATLVHCLRPDHLGPDPERIVGEVLSEEPVEIRMRVRTAEFAVVGPERARSMWWVVLLDTSHKRGDWLRPVTGWRAEAAERQAWEQGRRGGGVITSWLAGI